MNIVDDEQPVRTPGGTAYNPWPKEPTVLQIGGTDLRTENRLADIEAMLSGVVARFEREIEELRRNIVRLERERGEK